MMLGFWSEWVPFGVLLLYSSIWHFLININITEPYMDEIFHVRQTQNYCQGKFNEWDDKITTLPGLYLVPSLFSYLTSNGIYFCSLSSLRSFNFLIHLLTYFLLLSLIKTKNVRSKSSGYEALVLSLFPLNYFFSFIFYTDQLSTFTVLLMLYFSKTQKPLLASIAGGMSVLTRQTNIIWVVYISMCIVFTHLSPVISSYYKKNHLKISQITTHKSSSKNSKNIQNMSNKREGELLYLVSKGVLDLGPKILPFTVLVFIFIGFLYWNKGVVVGDRSAHVITINLPQLFYFSAFTGVFLFPSFLKSLPNTCRLIYSRPFLIIFLSVISLIIIHYNSVAHIYLLSDNRHYTFYIWKKLINYSYYSKYSLVPIYITLLTWLSSQHTHSITYYSLLFCIFFSIILQKLLEFRYFIIPFYLLCLEKRLSGLEWGLVGVFYFLVNTITLWVFAMRPFGEEQQRFMW